MDSSLYEMDLSLFDRDLLLVGEVPTSAEISLHQDGVEFSSKSLTSDFDTPVKAGLSTDVYSYTPDVDPFDSTWMESQVNLLDLLDCDIVADSDGPEASTGDFLAPEPQSADDAVEMLKSLAEETSQMLKEEQQQSVYEAPEEPSTALQLLDMLSGSAVPYLDLQDSVDDTAMDSPVLSPVTAEEVESILSSGPPSPGVLTPTTSVPPQDLAHSLLAQYLVSDIGKPKIEAKSEESYFESLSPEPCESDSSDPDYTPDTSYGQYRKTPYSRNKTKTVTPKVKSSGQEKISKAAERKLRKKQQNKDAAIRYRQKKRAEQDEINKECDQLQERNDNLRDKVDQMTREIKYLKNLLSEVYKAKGKTSRPKDK